MAARRRISSRRARSASRVKLPSMRAMSSGAVVLSDIASRNSTMSMWRNSSRKATSPKFVISIWQPSQQAKSKKATLGLLMSDRLLEALDLAEREDRAVDADVLVIDLAVAALADAALHAALEIHEDVVAGHADVVELFDDEAVEDRRPADDGV